MTEIDREEEGFIFILFADLFMLFFGMVLASESSDKGWEEKVVLFALHLF